ncbi:DNA polymerase epsilon subunit 3 [Sciurus carolinensis]|uniref:DNA polymerase epsilon subunit 3 n=1 Tax=Sciurus carolinensis TaxID=30640 RepID=A0AA41MGM3_SCICA|nr:DNA polymerase epsilon subunit 3 [Sciurus carolinensis]
MSETTLLSEQCRKLGLRGRLKRRPEAEGALNLQLQWRRGQRTNPAQCSHHWIIKEALPYRVTVSKEARSTLSHAATTTGLDVTSSTNHFTVKGRQRMPNASDMLLTTEEMAFQGLITLSKAALGA